VYHLQHEPPARAQICDVDGVHLIQREDDSPATIRRRLAVYHQDSEPLIAHYNERGLLREVDGTGPPEVVAERLRAAAAFGA
jgi:adenylate kinase